MGLDVPAPQRYVHWLGGLLRGDPGSLVDHQLPVAELIASRLPNSLLLAAVTALFAVPIALALGIAAAVWRGSWFDRLASTGAVAMVSVPEFLVATLAVLDLRGAAAAGCRRCPTSATSNRSASCCARSRCRY